MSDLTQSLQAPRSVGIERGASWITEAFGLFKPDAFSWIGACLIFLVICVVLSLIPIIGPIVLNLLMTVFMGGLIAGTHARHEGGEFTVNHLFAGFSKNTGQLLTVSVLYLVGFIVIMIVMVLLAFLTPMGVGMFQQMEHGDPQMMKNLTAVLLMVLIMLALYLPLVMAYWFAPALVILNDVSPLTAMKMSFKACLLNILPFLLYGIIALVLTIIGTIPLGLGMLVVGPMLMISVYTAYRDIFVY